MSDAIREKAILAQQARFKLYDLAREKWPESNGDASYLSEKLAKTMLDSGIYLNENSRLVDFSDEEYEATTATKGNKAKKTPKKWAIINMDSRDELVVLDENGTTLLFNNKEDARQAARDRFEDYHEDALDELVIRWNATHLSLKKNRGNAFSLVNPDEEPILAASKERMKGLTKSILDIIDLERIGDPEAIIPTGMYISAEEISQRVESARRVQITRRWDWIKEHQGVRDASGKYKIKKKGKDPSGKHGKHTNPGEVNLAEQVDFELVSILIDLLDREVPSIAEVLCRSHLWRTKEDGLNEEEGQIRPSLLSQEDIGCRVGDDLRRVASDMIRWQFSIQPIFDSGGSQIGSLELKTITGLVGRGGWSALPVEVNEQALSEAGLLGPMVPMVDAMERSDTVSQVLGSSIDAVIFRWDEARHSTRAGFPEDCHGVIEDGLHIVTSHDIMAYSMETGN